MRRPTRFKEKVYVACACIPAGKISTYAEIARSIGSPAATRAIGNALNKNPFKIVPCHRVVRSDGSVGGFAHGIQKKIQILRSEGIKVRKGKITSFSEMLFRL